MAVETILEKINRLEQQLLVHSILYYRLGTSLWTDMQYDTTAKGLKVIIEENPAEFKQSILYDAYVNFDWISGYDLPLYHEKYTKIAQWLLIYKDKK